MADKTPITLTSRLDRFLSCCHALALAIREGDGTATAIVKRATQYADSWQTQPTRAELKRALAHMIEGSHLMRRDEPSARRGRGRP